MYATAQLGYHTTRSPHTHLCTHTHTHSPVSVVIRIYRTINSRTSICQPLSTEADIMSVGDATLTRKYREGVSARVTARYL